jgi:hypothetical protein
MRRSPLPLVPLALLAALATASPVAAVPPDPPPVVWATPLSESLSGPAKDAYKAAGILRNNQDPGGALTKYRQAYELSSDPRLLFDMAVCERDLRAYARMQDLLLRYEREAGPDMPPAQKAEIDAALAAIRLLVGTVRLAVSEAGAAVGVDGEPAGSTPLANPLVVDLGKHTLSVSKAGFDPAVRTIEIAGGNEIGVTIRLVATVHAARLLVVADADATVMVDRQVVARGRFDGAMPPGHHDVQVTAPGKKPYGASIDLHDGEARTLLVTLENLPRGVGLWPWIAGGAVLAGGAVVGGYFLLKPHDEPAPPPQGTLPPVFLGGGTLVR